jgi:hypothetical protein
LTDGADLFSILKLLIKEIWEMMMIMIEIPIGTSTDVCAEKSKKSRMPLKPPDKIQMKKIA